MSRPPLPPFTPETTAQKARLAEYAWNSRDPGKVALAYTPDSQSRNRTDFITGRAEIVAFLTAKWARELEYRLIKEFWGFRENRIAVRFAYEWHDADGLWFRSYGNENWEFDECGLMRRRIASINDLFFKPEDRLFHWPQGRRPDDHSGLSEQDFDKYGVDRKRPILFDLEMAGHLTAGQALQGADGCGATAVCRVV